MSFEEIITLMENAVDYMDLYDAASYIVDDDLRVDVEQLIGQCEDDGDDVDVAYSVVTSDLLDMRVHTLNESKEDDTTTNKNTISDYIEDIDNVSNDKDFVNVLDDMETNKNLNQDLVVAIRQLFRNNRFMPLNNKIDTIKKFISTNDNTTTIHDNEIDVKEDEIKKESLTEAVETNADIENKSIDEIKNDDIETVDDIDVLEKRIGQQFSVGELNSILQLAFHQFKLFILSSDLYNMDLDKTQTITVDVDDEIYNINFDIIDVDSGIIELKGVEKEG